VVFVRKVPGRSGSTKVQVAERRAGRDVVLEHVGTARSDGELAILVAEARRRVRPGQQALDLQVDGEPVLTRSGVITGKRHAVLWQVLTDAYARLGFDAVGDAVFEQLVLARIIEPTSKADSMRVLDELGIEHASLRTVFRTLKRAGAGGYRDQVAAACFTHAASSGDVSLCLYDVTTLYFEAETEDDPRKVGYSKERRVDPQVVVELLVDRSGFPLEIGCFEGNKAETATIVPIIRQFQERHGIEGMVIVADAGMLSASNLKALDEAGLRFIVGSRVTKAPADLASHFRWHGDAFTDGQVIDTITPRVATKKAAAVNDDHKRAEPVWDPAMHERSWRAVWAYSSKRAARDGKTLTLQENRAKAVIAGEQAARTPRFVTMKSGSRSLDEASLARARRLVGLKGYVTNIPASLMPPAEVITSYHDLWHVEQSFRMSKTDLAARPIFARTREAIDAHLTVVFAALALSRTIQDRTGLSLRRFLRTLKPLRSATIEINGVINTYPPSIEPEIQPILTALQQPPPRH